MNEIIEVFGIDWKILFVQIVNFTILLGVLWYFLYKPITSLIEQRRTQIIQGVADAERAEAALKDADAKRGEVITRAALDAETMLAEARASAKKKEADILRTAQEKYERMLAEATLKGEEIKHTSLRESKEEIAKMVVLGAERVLRERSLKS
ncbi:MAG: F0F1 ATP synthase subunit B [Candidatus Pacebacteria bacterium]|nr:F0F1 ATP synthase subunit B [Candidatus Paceibacterota bacterium]